MQFSSQLKKQTCCSLAFLNLEPITSDLEKLRLWIIQGHFSIYIVCKNELINSGEFLKNYRDF